MAVKIDTHIHTSFSTDSETDMKEQILTSYKKGLEGICITDHMDYNFPESALEHPVDGIPFCFDLDDYFKRIHTLQKTAPLDEPFMPAEQTDHFAFHIHLLKAKVALFQHIVHDLAAAFVVGIPAPLQVARQAEVGLAHFGQHLGEVIQPYGLRRRLKRFVPERIRQAGMDVHHPVENVA